MPEKNKEEARLTYNHGRKIDVHFLLLRALVVQCEAALGSEDSQISTQPSKLTSTSTRIAPKLSTPEGKNQRDQRHRLGYVNGKFIRRDNISSERVGECNLNTGINVLSERKKQR